MRYLVDTNVLLRFFDLSDPRNLEVVAALDVITNSGTEAYVCTQVLIEYWAVATRRRDANGLGMSIEKSDENLSQIEALFDVLPEPQGIAERWREFVTRYKVIGRQARDARIAALMQAHDITHILTLNPRDFSRYEEVTAVIPHEIVGKTRH